MERRVLMTGVTGHSGKYAIERLKQRKDALNGLTFRVLARSTSNVTPILESGLPVEIVYGDIRDDAVRNKAMANVDTVLHIVGIHDSIRVMESAAQAGVRRVILVHTTGIYSKYKSASSDYIAIDEKVTQIAQAHGILLTILRPTMIYGGVDDQNVITFIRMMDKFPVMPVVSGANFVLQPVHRRDLGYAYADVLLAEAATAGKNYDLSGKEPITLRDMLICIARHLGKKEPVRFFSVPYFLAYAGAWGVYLLTIGKVDYREKVQRLVEPRAYPHDAATEDFGYAPMDFHQGVSQEVAAYLALKGNDA